MPKQRICYEVLKGFGSLPTSYDARNMCEGDYIYCYIHMLLDEEPEGIEEGINENFDENKFIEMSGDSVDDI